MVVVYQHDAFSSTIEYVSALAPFEYPGVAKGLNSIGAVAMDTSLPHPTASFAEVQRDLERLIRDVGDYKELPIIAIYDSRLGDIVIQPSEESINDRASRVARIAYEVREQEGRG